MSKTISNFTLLVLLLLASNAQSSGIDRFQVERSDGSLIDYYIRNNSPAARSNTILMVVQGSDCNSVARNASVNDLKLAWPGADLLLIEKYGITSALTYSKNDEREDCPTDYLKMDSLDQRVSDILLVIKEVDTTGTYENFLMIGGSEGAVVANTVASITNSIDATASFNGGGRWFLDDVIHSIRYGKKDTPELRSEIEGFTEMASNIISNKQMDVEISGHGSRWWRSVLQMDQLKQLGKVESPLLILQSEKDQSVSVMNTNKMIDSLIKNGKKNISYIKYAELDHSFRNSRGESKLTDVVKDISRWFSVVVETDSNKAMQGQAAKIQCFAQPEK
mgnify:FL=1